MRLGRGGYKRTREILAVAEKIADWMVPAARAIHLPYLSGETLYV